MFVSTTILGFVPVFEDPRSADTMAAAIIEDCKHENASLHAFVVMPEHIHLLLQVPPNLTGSDLLDRLKSAWANRILDIATSKCREALAEAKSRLRSRSVWQRSFHGLIVDRDALWIQKLEYIHANPVKRGLCIRPEEYRWSSAFLYESGLWKEELIVDDDAINLFWPDAVRDSLMDVTRRVSATGGTVAR